jgi:hypothetical protein
LEFDDDTLSGLSFNNGFNEDALGFALARLGQTTASARLKVISDLPPAAASHLRLHRCERPATPPVQSIVGALRRSFPSLTDSAYRLKRRLIPESYLIRGSCGNLRMQALIRGPMPKAALLSESMFDAPARVVPVPEGIHGEVDLEITLHPEAEGSGRDFVIPSAVRAMLDLPSSFAEYSDRLEHTAISDIRKIRKAGFGFRISRDPEDLLLFYKSMYLPTLQARHGDNAVPASFDDLEGFLMKGFLLIVGKVNSALGGALAYECGGGRLVLKSLGVLEGDLTLMKSGATSAIYYFSIQNACERGFSTLDLGLCAPFRTGGLITYKRKWDARFVADSGAEVISMRFREEKHRALYLSKRKPFLLGELECIEPPKP